MLPPAFFPGVLPGPASAPSDAASGPDAATTVSSRRRPDDGPGFAEELEIALAGGVSITPGTPPPSPPPAPRAADSVKSSSARASDPQKPASRDAGATQDSSAPAKVVATFANSAALTRQVNNLFSINSQSGQALVGAGLNAGRGSVQQGVLEQSNVDVANEFTQLIIAQRGFEVNARTITVSDQVLQDLTNIIR
jgi:flagellar hook-associated protein FlgK